MLTMWRGLDLARGSATTVTAQVRPSQGSYQRHFILAGVLFGLSAYTYSATRLLPVMFAAFGVYLFFFQRSLLRAQARNLSMMVILALIIALPMAIHIATEPAAERRLGEVEGPLDALQRGDVQPLVNSMAITAGMFIASGDPEWLYNTPGRPVFDAITGSIFYAGLLLCLHRFRQSQAAFIVIWLFFGLMPAMLTWPAASNSHGILAQTPAFLIAAIGLDAIATKLLTTKDTQPPAVNHRAAWLLVGSVLVIHSCVSINDYFNRWATHPIVQAEHQAGVAATARYFAQHPLDTPLVFSSGTVTHWNPWALTAFQMIAPATYTNARWLDARSSFIFPQGQTDLTLITPALDDAPAPLDARLIEELFPIVEPSPIATDYFSATHLVSSLNTRLITLTHAAVSWPDGRTAQLPIQFDDRVELIGYEVRKSQVEIGKNIRLTTYWRAQNLGLTPTSIFVHMLDDQGRLATQWDGWTIAPEYVQPGDILVQVHFIPIPLDFAAGAYRLELGLYFPQVSGQPRVPIVLDGQPVADRILLQSIQIKNAQ
jgi:hypothetical protein